MAYGTIRIASVARNNRFLPGKLNMAKAYPPNRETTSVKITVMPEIRTELSRYWARPAW